MKLLIILGLVIITPALLYFLCIVVLIKQCLIGLCDDMGCWDDEDNYESTHREPSEYTDLLVYECGDGKTLELEHVCNNITDCKDGSDEMDCKGMMYMTYGRKNPNSKLLKPPPIRREKKKTAAAAATSASNDKYNNNQPARQNPKEDPKVDEKVTKRTAQKDSGSADPSRAEGEEKATAAVSSPSEDLAGSLDNVCPIEKQPAPVADYAALAQCPAKVWPWSFDQLVQDGQLLSLYDSNGTGSSDSGTSVEWTRPESTALITTVQAAEQSDQEPSLLLTVDGHSSVMEYYITGPRIMRVKISGLKDSLSNDRDSQNLPNRDEVPANLKMPGNVGQRIRASTYSQVENEPVATNGANPLSGFHTALLKYGLWTAGACLILGVLWALCKYYLACFRARYPREVIEVGPDDTSLVEFQNCNADSDDPHAMRTVRATYSRGQLALRVLPQLPHIEMSDDDFDDEEVAGYNTRYYRGGNHARRPTRTCFPPSTSPTADWISAQGFVEPPVPLLK
ncbi:uncharacterized protein LOC126839541 [Adelges cooleyi]|uniref:uncharacterized protein LOC126839541 n=1 Tax=Adelges cooleyi TaxID=133065 RepID=UPI0021808B25|nr:uncharacterized protein LOC126839541 [Adelges cooleyi]